VSIPVAELGDAICEIDGRRLRPRNDYVLVRRLPMDRDDVRVDSIWIAQTAQGMDDECVVLAVGPGRDHPLDVQVGDHVLIGNFLRGILVVHPELGRPLRGDEPTRLEHRTKEPKIRTVTVPADVWASFGPEADDPTVEVRLVPEPWITVKTKWKEESEQ
jgi:co-chaperonin GroES (HSP10)